VKRRTINVFPGLKRLRKQKKNKMKGMFPRLLVFGNLWEDGQILLLFSKFDCSNVNLTPTHGQQNITGKLAFLDSKRHSPFLKRTNSSRTGVKVARIRLIIPPTVGWTFSSATKMWDSVNIVCVASWTKSKSKRLHFVVLVHLNLTVLQGEAVLPNAQEIHHKANTNNKETAPLKPRGKQEWAIKKIQLQDLSKT
jgi:hypothetical protein